MEINLVLQGFVNGSNGQNICVWIDNSVYKCIHIKCASMDEALKLQYKRIQITVNQDKLELMSGTFKLDSQDIISSSVL